MLYLNTAACRVTFCIQDPGQKSRGQRCRVRTVCGTRRAAVQSSWPGQRGSAGVLAFADLGDEVPDGGEGEVRAVAEGGVTRPGKGHQAGGAGRQLAG